jgi:hypothetical protein
MSTTYSRIGKALKAQHMTWADLGRTIGVTDQVINNWSRREVPAKHHAAIARVLGWSIEHLLGEGEPPTAPQGMSAPEPSFTKRANDLATMFDELKDPAVRRQAYATVQAVLQMAKAGQQVPSPPALEPTPTPKLLRHAPAPTPKRVRAR